MGKSLLNDKRAESNRRIESPPPCERVKLVPATIKTGADLITGSLLTAAPDLLVTRATTQNTCLRRFSLYEGKKG